MLAALTAEPLTVQRDYDHLPMLFVRLRSPSALQALLRAYPNNPAARKAMRPQAKCKKAM